jgi:hypothetical protein
VRAAHPQANITAVDNSLGGTLAQDTKGTNKQITFNKGTSAVQAQETHPDTRHETLSHFQRGKLSETLWEVERTVLRTICRYEPVLEMNCLLLI